MRDNEIKGCEGEIVVDEIEFFNAGTYPNPYPGVKIKARERDLKTRCKIRLFGTDAENIQDILENEIEEYR